MTICFGCKCICWMFCHFFLLIGKISLPWQIVCLWKANLKIIDLESLNVCLFVCSIGCLFFHFFQFIVFDIVKRCMFARIAWGQWTLPWDIWSGMFCLWCIWRSGESDTNRFAFWVNVGSWSSRISESSWTKGIVKYRVFVFFMFDCLALV